jgi:archaeal flagellar protein FlaJ
MKTIPFVPFRFETATKASRIFLWLSSRVVKFNPFLSQNLSQSGIEIKDREYMALTIFSSVFWFLMTFSLFTLFGIILGKNIFLMSIIFSFLMSVFVSTYISFFPILIISKKNMDIDRNLLFAMRHLFIQVRSGVSLFDAIVSISKNNYGIISEEFGKCAKEIVTGKEEINALEEMTLRNPNIGFKRVIWQMVNSLRAGGDIGKTLNSMSKDLSEEQKVKIRKYGSQLSPMALMYLMFTVILPTLGITFLVIFSTFSGIQISQSLFYMILFVLTIFQFMFIGLVKSRRPSVEV